MFRAQGLPRVHEADAHDPASPHDAGSERTGPCGSPALGHEAKMAPSAREGNAAMEIHHRLASDTVLCAPPLPRFLPFPLLHPLL